MQIAYFTKKRLPGGIVHSKLFGEVEEQVILIDDIIDTGATLISACIELKRKGVKNITIMVTHGLFTGNVWERLWKFGVQRIYCTDSVPLREQLLREERIGVLSVKAFLADSIKEKFYEHYYALVGGSHEIS